MLVAKRDPFELGAPGAAATSSRSARALHVLQLLGALIAVPAGIGSAYTMYKTNYAPEAACQSLRGNIVAMLDKSVDASMRHMLVRRDVEAFQQSCGAVDPDATAAFKALLAAEKTAAPVATASVPPAEPQPQTVMRKAEPAPAVKAKPLAARVPAVSAAPIQHDAAVSDAAWLAAVRNALVTHERAAAPAATPAAVAPPSPAAPPRTLGELRTPAAPPPAPLAAPALPPPASVATVDAPQPQADHPVPPGAIPETASGPNEQERSRFGELVAQIPFVGKSIADRVSR